MLCLVLNPGIMFYYNESVLIPNLTLQQPATPILADMFAYTYLQGVPYHWAHFVFVIFSGSRAHTEELLIAII